MPEKEEKRVWVKSFEFEVSAPNITIPLIEFDLPKDAKYIKAVRIESDAIPTCYNRGFIGIELSNNEVVPPVTSVQMFMYSDNSEKKFMDEIGDFPNDAAKMRLTFTDKGTFAFSTYKVRVMLLLEK